MFTWGKKNSDDAAYATDNHAECKRPATSKPIHEHPTDKIAGNLNKGGQQKAEILIITKSRPIVA